MPKLCFSRIKQLILKCDLFCTTEFFRYEEEPQYRTLTGAFCSLSIVIFFLSVFTNVMIVTLAKSQVVWSLNTVEEEPDQFQVRTSISGKEKFMFAVSILGLNLNDTVRYFDVTMQLNQNQFGNSSKTTVQLQPCKMEAWNVTPQLEATYNRLNFNTYLCPPLDLMIPLQGKFTSDIFSYADIKVKRCDQTLNLSRPCASNTTMSNLFSSNTSLYMNFYFLNTILNPDNETYISYYLEDRNYIQFSANFGGLINLFIDKYQVTTDQSIYPYKDQRIEEGGIVNSLGQVINFETKGTDFAKVVLRRSSTSLLVSRSFKKIDETLSYIGGLFGFIVTAFLFMRIYTEYSFQVQLGSLLFRHDTASPSKQQPEQQSFNFLYFIGYVLYAMFDTIGFKLPSQKMKKVDDYRQEIQKHFDIRFLFRRLNFLQNSMKLLFNENQFRALHLNRKITLSEAQSLREYYNTKQNIKNEAAFSEVSHYGEQRAASNKIYPENDESHQQLPGQIIVQAKPATLLDSITNKIKFLHKQSQKGDELSRKIYSNIDSSIVKIIFSDNFQPPKDNMKESHISNKIDESFMEELADEVEERIIAHSKSNKQKNNEQVFENSTFTFLEP